MHLSESAHNGQSAVPINTRYPRSISADMECERDKSSILKYLCISLASKCYAAICTEASLTLVINNQQLIM
uniref:Ovule protein n=1 Tax=Heterorhabditis bacteriophora TaxID=37862 RepID=A0A1I7X358_HETBA